VKNLPINEGKVYKIAISDFLMTGKESNMGFLTKDDPGVVKIYPVFTGINDPRSDIRRAIINYLSGL
jgi:5'-nucleotidase